jgi:hypothetical protein
MQEHSEKAGLTIVAFNQHPGTTSIVPGRSIRPLQVQQLLFAMSNTTVLTILLQGQ